ncbi:acyl-ACP--UDP-N-acetylglucosamine O-acyltransferase [Saccharospirillum salsuginis]|uniref:Acyl-[acyl-carrier-protein]--UDP-N-acetylglucosamine O-acyltransferase n=1 Tax=Saccharospirillum salsuginis TaxID=418750 RepID=A0A918NE94_9GAMM|nr:acyl-ACP--UDP-N-acetylglucosamine O-acyltransferase [Saccharospirillum salsuginis]GGX61597.1 acyl-[acyl-carrier-protein]--UDP-N-acetylglucosamine O-acyltransferase [Saccharospirillum salsuginis]
MIHSTVQIDPSARIADKVTIGPFSVIGPDVEIGEGTWIGPHVVVNGPTTIGRYNKIFQFASVGEACQDLKYKGEPTRLIIGDHNTIREFATLHRGTIQDSGETRVGSHCLVMAYAHIAHDVVVGDSVIMANNAQLAGHVHVGDHAIIGGNCGVHQFVSIGAHAFLGAGSTVLKDVPAFVTVQGYPATPHGMNVEGLRRRGFQKPAMTALRRAYKIVYREGKTVREALDELAPLAEEHPEVRVFVDSIEGSKRGIVR